MCELIFGDSAIECSSNGAVQAETEVVQVEPDVVCNEAASVGEASWAPASADNDAVVHWGPLSSLPPQAGVPRVDGRNGTLCLPRCIESPSHRKKCLLQPA